MKKIATLLMAALLAVGACFGLTACSSTKYTGQVDQDTAFLEVKAGTSDIAIMDNVMAGFYVNKAENSDMMLLTSNEFTFSGEYYAIGFRKGGNTAEYINYALYSLQQVGALQAIAAKYGLLDAIDEIEAVEKPAAPAATSDFGEILAKGEMILGYTLFEPIAYMDGDSLIGYDIDLAKAVCAFLSIEYGKILELKPIKINWETKEDELEAKNIDCIWNGFTYTDERAENISFSQRYMINRQIMVIRKADKDKYTSYAAMKEAKFTAEKGSAGETTFNKVIKAKVEAK